MNIVVAAVQVASQNGNTEANLEHATPLVARAAQLGGEVVLLPELMPSGFIFDTSLWDAAEPKHGKTVKWLRETSKRLGVWLGTTYLEADGEDFYNTFVLTSPEGMEAGRVRKQAPCGFESFFTRGYGGPHVIPTEIGRIGVGICYETQLCYLPHLMYQQSADLLLMPHSAAMPVSLRIWGRGEPSHWEKQTRQLTARFAGLLGVPAILANKCGEWRSPLPVIPLVRRRSRFAGLSSIATADGVLRAQLGGEEGVIAQQVSSPSPGDERLPPGCQGRWAWEGPCLRNSVRALEALGRAWYASSRERRTRAREASSKGDVPP